MLDAAVLLDLTVSAMVVGKEKSFRRNELSRASAAEQHDSILEGRLVDAVYVLGVKPEAFFLHICDTLRDQRRKPHAFVSLCRHAYKHCSDKNDDLFGVFHVVICKCVIINMLFCCWWGKSPTNICLYA